MALTLTATVLAGLAAVRLEVAGAAAGALTIIRTDTTGPASVRLLPGQTPSAGSLIVTDYEPALTGGLSYTVTDASNATATTATALNAGTPWLHLPVLPQYRAVLQLITRYRADQEPEGTTHQVINRADPITVLGPLHTRTGEVTMLALTYSDARAIASVLAVGEVAQLRQPTYPGMDMYLTPGRVTVEPVPDATPTQRWQVTIAYTEVAAPSAGLAGAAGWTFNDVKNTYATFAAVKAAYATFRTLVIGP